MNSCPLSKIFSIWLQELQQSAVIAATDSWEYVQTCETWRGQETLSSSGKWNQPKEGRGLSGNTPSIKSGIVLRVVVPIMLQKTAATATTISHFANWQNCLWVDSTSGQRYRQRNPNITQLPLDITPDGSPYAGPCSRSAMPPRPKMSLTFAIRVSGE